jgi:hypothetical protein
MRRGDLQLAVTQLAPGDCNGNGFVDAADYSVWRDSLGQTGSGAGANVTVPEPKSVF